jgi:hypothetical protein
VLVPESPGDLVAVSARLLADPATAPLDRVACAVVVAAGGDRRSRTTFDQVAELAGIPATDVRLALYALRELGELRAELRG